MKIIPIKKKPNADAIQVLESALNSAKNGEIVAVGLSWITGDGSIGGDVSSGVDGIKMWASLEHSSRSFYEDILRGE